MQHVSQPINYVFYWSRCRNRAYDVTDIDIMRSSIRNNAASNITGFLHREAEFYIQYFEGPEGAVNQLRDTLLTDTRHFNFQLLDTGRTPTRIFSEWSMGYSNERKSQIGLSERKITPNHLDPLALLDFLLVTARDQVGARKVLIAK